MHRLLVDFKTLQADAPVLPPPAAHHLKVVRPKAGEAVELFDGAGHQRLYRWDAAAARLCRPGPMRVFAPPARELTLFACVTKGSRWDWTIEKAVELGVRRIVPVLSARCIVTLKPAERLAKAERWRRVAEEAARQSDAAWLAEIVPPVDFPEALARARQCARVFVGALTSPPPPPLLTAVETAREEVSKDRGDVGFFVGPEGDFTPEELSRLLTFATPVSLGPTILRAETAALYGLCVLAAAFARDDARQGA